MGMLLIVSDLQKSKALYQTILGQTEMTMDTPQMVSFGTHEFTPISLSPASWVQSESDEPWFSAKMRLAPKTNNFQLYFETNDIDAVAEKIKATEGIEVLYFGEGFINRFPQRAIRFYDYDGHLIEVAESLQVLARRLLAQGLTMEEVAKSFGVGDTVEMIQEILTLE